MQTLLQTCQKKAVFIRKALKEVFKTLAEAVVEIWIERGAAIKLIEQRKTAQAQLELIDNGIILAVPDSNTIHIHDNIKLPIRPK